MKFSEDVVKNFIDYVKKVQREHKYRDTGDAFVHSSLIWLFDKRDYEASVASYIGAGGHDKGIDAFFEGLNYEIFILQGKFHEKTDYKVGDSDIEDLLKDLKKAYKVLESEDKKISQKVRHIKNQYESFKELWHRPVYVFVVFGAFSKNYRKKLKKKAKRIAPGWRFKIYDRDEIIKQYNKMVMGPERGPNIKKFRVHDPKISKFPPNPRTLIFSALAYDIAKIVRENRNSIFRLNVREFKGGTEREKINYSILRTLRSKEERKYFWFYNLGINAVCDVFELKRNKLDAVNFQVVNGCQTCNLLAEKITKRNKDKYKDVFVLVRLFETGKKQRVGLARKITIRNNAQNPIDARDIMSQDTHQIRLQNELARMKIFYERRANDWKQLGSKQELYDEMIKNTGVAKAFASFELEEPAIAKTTSILFASNKSDPDGLYEKIFDNISPYQLLLAHKIWGIIKSEQRKFNRHQNKLTRKSKITKFISYADTTLTAMFGLVFRKKYGKGHVKDLSKPLYEKLSDEESEVNENFVAAYHVLREILKKHLEKKIGENFEKETPRNYLIRPSSFAEIEKSITESDIKKIKKLLPSMRLVTS